MQGSGILHGRISALVSLCARSPTLINHSTHQLRISAELSLYSDNQWQPHLDAAILGWKRPLEFNSIVSSH